jgi:DNA (cytosine-5)-methyltransferase 1
MRYAELGVPMTKKFTAIDLFCGAGGMSLGLKRAGFEVVSAFDNWAPAVETYKANLGDHVRCQMIDSGMNLPQVDVIVGGPPCQGFSSAGLRLNEDSRNTLVGEFSSLISKIRPSAFIFENVEGFLTAKNGYFVMEFLKPLIANGYRIHLRKVNAANFGVPQHRKRVLAIGGLGWNPTFPNPTHAASGAPGAHLGNGSCSIPTPTVDEAFKKINSVASIHSITDHIATAFVGPDLIRAQHLRPGQSMRDLPEEFWHKSYKNRAFRRVKDGTPSEHRGGAPFGVRRLRGDQPSKAITGGALRDSIHPLEDRPLTIRECATLQTFPLDFLFCGSQQDRIQLIGNAVPVFLAEVIGTHLISDLTAATPLTEEGSLLSFVPTLSNGKSPVLSRVCRTIERHFQKNKAQMEMSWD